MVCWLSRNAIKLFAALHILVRCVIPHRFLLFRFHIGILCLPHLSIESVMVSIPKETIESERFG